METAKASDTNSDSSCQDERGTWLATLRRLKENCQFDEYRDAVVGSRFADTAVGHLELARLELHRNEPEAALALLDELVGREPDFAPAAAWRIATLDRLSRFDDALKAADAALDRHPDSVDVRVSIARLHTGRGRDSEALVVINTALELGPADTGALIWRTRILTSSGRQSEAERSAREALVASPSEQRLLTELGLLLRGDDRVAEALAEFERVLEIDAFNARALEWRATALRELFRRDDAEAAILAAIALRPLVPALHLELGHTLKDQGRYDEALAAIDHAIDLCPSSRIAFETRTRILRVLRRWSDAEDSARNLVHSFPRVRNAFVNRGWVFHFQDRNEEALA
ncbi:MAG: tetratricopeptide repeat protein, partial [Catenulisporales bacterium]|nr:tetratricopeptide repeat protein [Catenulisporales bacterium]